MQPPPPQSPGSLSEDSQTSTSTFASFHFQQEEAARLCQRPALGLIPSSMILFKNQSHSGGSRQQVQVRRALLQDPLLKPKPSAQFADRSMDANKAGLVKL